MRMNAADRGSNSRIFAAGCTSASDAGSAFKTNQSNLLSGIFGMRSLFAIKVQKEMSAADRGSNLRIFAAGCTSALDAGSTLQTNWSKLFVWFCFKENAF